MVNFLLLKIISEVVRRENRSRLAKPGLSKLQRDTERQKTD